MFGINGIIVIAIGFAVGFIAGVIHGATSGYNLGNSLLNGLEGALAGVVGGLLAYVVVGVALGVPGIAGASGVGLSIAVGAAVVGGLNGVIGGAMQAYRWRSWTGWAAFLFDSTWGLIGTTLSVILHGVNVFNSNRTYRRDLSFRQNRHLYDGGFGFGDFALTLGNVTSNLAGGGGGAQLANHEALHILQSRLFGPIFQTVYVAWLIVGAIVGGILGIFVSQPWRQSTEDMAYYNNPWETWAYKQEGPNPSGHHGGKLSWS